MSRLSPADSGAPPAPYGVSRPVGRLDDARTVRRLEAVDWDFPAHNPRPGTQGIHSLHWYPAPFPAALPGTMLDILVDGPCTAVDPFCGSGVAVIEAWTRGHSAVGIDVNRFAIELVGAKAALLASGRASRGAELADAYTAAAAAGRAHGEACGRTAATRAGMDSGAADWFEPDVLSDIADALEWIRAQDAPDAAWLWVLLSSLLHKSSVLRHVHYTYVVDRSRTTAPPAAPVDLPAAFAAKIRRSLRDAERARQELAQAGVDPAEHPPPLLIAGRAEDGLAALESKADVIVTSPPYFGMNDYVRSQYLSWLIQPWEGFDEDRLAEAGARRERRRAGATEQYVRSMQSAFAAAAGLLRPGGHLAVVIGASRTELSRAADPVGAVRLALAGLNLRPIWTGARNVRHRKINNSPGCVEEIWVLQAE